MKKKNYCLYVFQYAIKETFGAILQKHWLVSVKPNSPYTTPTASKCASSFFVSGKNEKPIATRHVFRSKGDFKSATFFV